MAKYWKMIGKILFLTLFVIHQCVGPPTKNKEPGQVNNSSSSESGAKSVDELGLEYSRYLKEVVEVLESDPEFRKKLEKADEVDFRSGKVAAELMYINHNVRTKLDELKRAELQRLKQLVKESQRLEKQGRIDHENVAGHIDHTNEHTFEVADLHKLITKVRLDLEEADRKRRQDFKEYEMQKQFEQEQKMKAMDEEHKKQYQEQLESQKKKHQQHDPLHHPGSKAQLEEVWEKEDHMENQKFNPRAFFHLHDLDGNGYWDEEEVKALFIKEVQKVYDAGAPEDDMRDRDEEMERMREHVFAEADTNHDRLISYEEFLEQTKKQEFERDDGWESIDQKPQFTQQEYAEFEKRRQAEIQRLIEQGVLQPYAPGMMPPLQYGVHPGQYQQHPGAGYVQVPHHGMNQVPQYQYGGQMQHHPNQVPQQQQYQVNHPDQMVPQYHPNQAPVQYSNQVPVQHPNQVPVQHPNQVPVQHPNQVPVQHPNQVPVQHPNQVPVQHPNQVPVQHPNQVPVQHPNQVPVQHPNQVPQQQYKPISNEIPKQTLNQAQQMPNNALNQAQQVPTSMNQQIPQQAAGQNQAGAPPQPPQQYQQYQSNDLPQGQQYQSKYEPHGNRVASNEKNVNNSPK